MKSYDTAWATMMIEQYLAPGGYVVSLQNCMNEETIAGIVGWGKTLGSIAVLDHGRTLPRRAMCTAPPARAARRIPSSASARCMAASPTARRRSCRLVGLSDSAKVTENLWGERWSKLVTNVMGNGMSACTGMISRDILVDDTMRHFSARLGGEAIRVGQALGYELEEILHMDPEVIAKAGEGDAGGQEATTTSTAWPRRRSPAAARTAPRWARTW